MRQYIKQKINLKKISAAVGLMFLILFALSAPINAQSVTQGYDTDNVLQRGTVVSLDSEDTAKVVATTKENQMRLHGIVISQNDSAFTLSDEEEKTFVANIGRYDALVSTEAGAIEAGDFLAVSSITGIAMKAGENDLMTVGKAIVGFNGDEFKISDTQISDTAGNSNTVAIGRIPIDIGVGSNPLLKPADSSLPDFLESATEAIAGKQVSPVKVYIGMVIILASGAIAGALLYSGIKSSLISVGRNPLSKKSITKSMLQVILTSIIIFLIGIFGVYLLLRL